MPNTPTTAALLLSALSCIACKKAEAPESSEKTSEVAPIEAPAAKTVAPSSPPPGPHGSHAAAAVGSPAPTFSLPDLDGAKVSLEQQRGKIVVLEWFNPQCPYVKAAHTKGSLVDTAKKLTEKGVVYLAVNSAAPGKQGYGVELNREGVATFDIQHPILLDEDGAVGHAYGATNTPHIFVIDAEGVLRYRGAIDNSPDGEGESPRGGTLVNYLSQAVTELLEKKPVSTPETKAYGCSVKYAQ